MINENSIILLEEQNSELNKKIEILEKSKQLVDGYEKTYINRISHYKHLYNELENIGLDDINTLVSDMYVKVETIKQLEKSNKKIVKNVYNSYSKFEQDNYNFNDIKNIIIEELLKDKELEKIKEDVKKNINNIDNDIVDLMLEFQGFKSNLEQQKDEQKESIKEIKKIRNEVSNSYKDDIERIKKITNKYEGKLTKDIEEYYKILDDEARRTEAGLDSSLGDTINQKLNPFNKYFYALIPLNLLILSYNGFSLYNDFIK